MTCWRGDFLGHRETYPMCTSQGEIQMVVWMIYFDYLRFICMSLIAGCFVRLSLKLGIPTERIKSYPGNSVHFPSSPHGCQIRKTVWQNRLAKPKGARLHGTGDGLGKFYEAAITSPTYAPMSWCSNPNQSWSPFIIEGGRISKQAKLLQEPHPSCTPVASFLSCCKVQQP